MAAAAEPPADHAAGQGFPYRLSRHGDAVRSAAGNATMRGLAGARGTTRRAPKPAASSRNSAAIAPTAWSAASMPAMAKAWWWMRKPRGLLDFAAGMSSDERRAVRHHLRRAAARLALRRVRQSSRAGKGAGPAPLVGWKKVTWRKPASDLARRHGDRSRRAGQGICRGPRAGRRVSAITDAPVLVNFGGDLAVNRPRAGGKPWKVAIESVERQGEAAGLLELRTARSPPAAMRGAFC